MIGLILFSGGCIDHEGLLQTSLQDNYPTISRIELMLWQRAKRGAGPALRVPGA